MLNGSEISKYSCEIMYGDTDEEKRGEKENAEYVESELDMLHSEREPQGDGDGRGPALDGTRHLTVLTKSHYTQVSLHPRHWSECCRRGWMVSGVTGKAAVAAALPSQQFEYSQAGLKTNIYSATHPTNKQANSKQNKLDKNPPNYQQLIWQSGPMGFDTKVEEAASCRDAMPCLRPCMAGLSQNLDTNSRQQHYRILHSAVFYFVTHRFLRMGLGVHKALRKVLKLDFTQPDSGGYRQSTLLTCDAV
ncbi:hypothetical protein ACRRTK_014477 [Alexandromys fortis]